jgi:ribosomal protein S12 methylthiotransferase accessory factor
MISRIEWEDQWMDVDIAFPGDKKVTASFNGFMVETDQPVSQGGEGAAPDPFELFIASIATCTGYYALNFCLMRNIPISGLGLTMRTARDEEKKMTGKIVIEIVLPSDFPSKYESALVRAVGLCTVKKHIQNPPEFEIYIGR